MNCKECGSETKVLFSSAVVYGRYRYRVRVCKKESCRKFQESMEVPIDKLSRRFNKAIENGRTSRAVILKWLKTG